jgi:TPR repeat protein
VGQKGAQARALFEKACKAGDMLACNHLGQLYQNGLGARNDIACASHPDL